jgi:hypothetical protein
MKEKTKNLPKLKEGELRIFYRHPERIDIRLDKALENILKTLGYKWESSGFNLIDEVRDLAFNKKSGK